MSSSCTAAGQAEPAKMFSHLMREMQQLKEGLRSQNTPSEADLDGEIKGLLDKVDDGGPDRAI